MPKNTRIFNNGRAVHPRKRETDQRIRRLMFILNKLDRGERLHTQEIADEYGISIRSVQRYIDILCEAGFPIGPALEKGVYTFAEGFSLKKMKLSSEEASLLSFLFDISKSLGRNFEDSFRDILKKVIQTECDTAFYAKIPEVKSLNRNGDIVKVLEEAILESRKVTVKYRLPDPQGIKIFTACPLKIVFYDGYWYLASQVCGKDGIIKLRIDHIESADAINEHFTASKNLKTVLDESANIWFSDKRDKKAILHISKDVARYFKDRSWFPMQKITKESEDGSLILESKYSHEMELVPTILRWLPHIKIIGPKSMKDEVLSRIQGYK